MSVLESIFQRYFSPSNKNDEVLRAQIYIYISTAQKSQDFFSKGLSYQDSAKKHPNGSKNICVRIGQSHRLDGAEVSHAKQCRQN